jgi:cytochrome c-type protein NapC
MAKRVWDEMKSNNSRECHNCHNAADMNLEKQSRRAQRKHNPEYLAKTGKTCIDCHKGIAHELPEEDDEDEDEEETAE